MNAVSNDDAFEPLAADRAGPTAADETQREAVLMRNVLAVHRPGNQRFVLERLADGHASRDGYLVRVATCMHVGCVIGDVNSIVIESDELEHIAQACTGPFRAADGADGPLVAGGRRHELAAAVAAAFEL